MWHLLALWVLLGGLVASAVAGWGWDRYQTSQARHAFVAQASGITATINTGVQRDLDLQQSIGHLVATMASPSNTVIGPWLESQDLAKKYPGTIGFAFVIPVSPAGLAAYETAVTRDPIPGIGPGPYPVYPPGKRNLYCVARYGVFVAPTGEPAGFDSCAPTLLGAKFNLGTLLEDSARTGQTELFTSLSIVSGESKTSQAVLNLYKGRYFAAVPIYDARVAPVKASARAATILGWVVGDFDGPGLISPALGSSDRLSVSLRSGPVLLAALGPAKYSDWTTVSRSLSASSGLTVTVAGPESSAPVLQGVGLGLLGALLTLVVCAFAFHLSRSREIALRLVSERTEELRHQALHDSLTDLPNRALLFDRADRMLARSRRHPGSVGALFIDLDNFKDVNDSLGHNTGDALLVAVAERLRACVRDSDTVGRLGGDEFLVLTEDPKPHAEPGCHDDPGRHGGAELVAERIIAVLAEPFVLHDPTEVTLNVKASVGVATGVHSSAEHLIRDADVALYQAKNAGKGCFVTFRTEMQTAITDRLSLEADLRTALANDEMFVVYQPIFDLETLTTKGVEALLRWRHPTRGLVPPSEFIPIAEQIGTISALGEFVLDEACGRAAVWHCRGHRIGVSVNVSVAQFDNEGFVDTVRWALNTHFLDAHLLTLEITESVLMHDTVATTRILHELKKIGVRVAVDDFGTGYSSLAYLRQFPIDSLKIDRSFIAKADHSSQSTQLVRSLVQLGKALGIETLAEGIEHPSQLSDLQRQHCDSGQGFLYARPLPADEVEAFLVSGPPQPGPLPDSQPVA